MECAEFKIKPTSFPQVFRGFRVCYVARRCYCIGMSSAPRLPGFRGEFLWELDIVVRQIVLVAEAIPAEKYEWRPSEDARSVSQVLIHVSAGTFMLLDSMGITAPADLYGQIPAGGRERFRGLTEKNDEME